MGNCCGKAESESFAQPGRTLGSAPPPQPASAPLPNKVGGPPRTLGGSSTAAQTTQDDARMKAAEAAEARAKASSKPGGKLASQLSAQKKQTRNDTLKEASEQQLRARESDQVAETRNWA